MIFDIASNQIITAFGLLKICINWWCNHN